MKLSSVLASIKGTETEKIASVADSGKTAAAPSTTGEKLKQALKEAAASGTPSVEKNAAAGSPVNDLMKTASQIVGAEHEALVKEAQLYGCAVADGFLTRIAQHTDAVEKIASAQPGKTAAAPESFEKFASDNPELVKEAAELGYTSTLGQMEKLAEVAYTKGYNGAVETIYKLAHASFVQGFENAAQLITELRK